jgi:hypothetical protein
VQLAAHDLYDAPVEVLKEKIESLPCVRAGSAYETGAFVTQPAHFERSFRASVAVAGTEAACFEELKLLFRDSMIVGVSGPSGAMLRLSFRTTQ